MSITCPVKSETKSLAVATATSIDFNKVSSGSIPKFLVRIGVFVRSGFTQFTRMPKLPHSSAKACTKFTVAHFVDE